MERKGQGYDKGLEKATKTTRPLVGTSETSSLLLAGSGAGEGRESSAAAEAASATASPAASLLTARSTICACSSVMAASTCSRCQSSPPA